MGRFETELLANDENLAALADLSGVWIDRVHARNENGGDKLVHGSGGISQPRAE